MQRPKVFATVIFIRDDHSSGVDHHETDYDAVLSAGDYATFFLDKTKRNKAIRIAKLLSLDRSEHDGNGNYLLDKFNRIKRIPSTYWTLDEHFWRDDSKHQSSASS